MSTTSSLITCINDSTKGNITNVSGKSNSEEDVDLGDLSNLLTDPEVDGKDGSEVNEIIDQMNNDDQMQKCIGKRLVD